jgi:hypothetical protein
MQNAGALILAHASRAAQSTIIVVAAVRHSYMHHTLDYRLVMSADSRQRVSPRLPLRNGHSPVVYALSGITRTVASRAIGKCRGSGSVCHASIARQRSVL